MLVPEVAWARCEAVNFQAIDPIRRGLGLPEGVTQLWYCYLGDAGPWGPQVTAPGHHRSSPRPTLTLTRVWRGVRVQYPFLFLFGFCCAISGGVLFHSFIALTHRISLLSHCSVETCSS